VLATVGVLCNKAGAEESRPSRQGGSVRRLLSSNRHTLAANVGETDGRVDETERASGMPAEELAELSGRSSPPSGGSDTKVRVRTLHAYPDLL
jgi:hypothetical protein